MEVLEIILTLCCCNIVLLFPAKESGRENKGTSLLFNFLPLVGKETAKENK